MTRRATGTISPLWRWRRHGGEAMPPLSHFRERGEDAVSGLSKVGHHVGAQPIGCAPAVGPGQREPGPGNSSRRERKLFYETSIRSSL